MAMDPAALYGQEALDSFFKTLSVVNAYSPIEGAGAHGNWGGSLGIAVHSLQVESSLAADQLGLDEKNEEFRQAIPRIVINKGLFYPLDVGLNYGLAFGNNAKIFGAHAQWTLLESLGLPALALRANYSQTNFLQSSSMRSSGIGPEISHGFLRYFNFYAGIQRRWHIGSVYLNASEKALYLSESNLKPSTIDENHYQKRWSSHPAHVGLALNITSLFMSLGGEVLIENGMADSYLIKLAYGI